MGQALEPVGVTGEHGWGCWAVVAVAAAVTVSQAHRRTSSAPPTGPTRRPTARSARRPAARCRRRAASTRRSPRSRPADTRVVCQDSSIRPCQEGDPARPRRAAYKAPADPEGASGDLEAPRAAGCSRFNRLLRAQVQVRARSSRPVTRSGNNDRVVIMPGIYTEPESRAAPTHDPKCADLRNDQQTTAASQSGAVLLRATSAKCPNDQNLIAVIGRGRRQGHRPAAAALRTGTGSPTSARASAATSRSRARASAPTT